MFVEDCRRDSHDFSRIDGNLNCHYFCNMRLLCNVITSCVTGVRFCFRCLCSIQRKQKPGKTIGQGHPCSNNPITTVDLCDWSVIQAIH
jgi:hypothetical protein